MPEYRTSRIKHQVHVTKEDIARVRKVLDRDEYEGPYEYRIVQVHLLALSIKDLDVRRGTIEWAEFICKLDKALKEGPLQQYIDDGPQMVLRIEQYNDSGALKQWVQDQLMPSHGHTEPSDSPEELAEASIIRSIGPEDVVELVEDPVREPQALSSRVGSGEHRSRQQVHSITSDDTDGCISSSLPAKTRNNVATVRRSRRQPDTKIGLSKSSVTKSVSTPGSVQGDYLTPLEINVLLDYQRYRNEGGARLLIAGGIVDVQDIPYRRSHSANPSPSQLRPEQDTELELRTVRECQDQIMLMADDDKLPLCKICGRRHLPNDPTMREIWLTLMGASEVSRLLRARARGERRRSDIVEVESKRDGSQTADILSPWISQQHGRWLCFVFIAAAVVCVAWLLRGADSRWWMSKMR